MSINIRRSLELIREYDLNQLEPCLRELENVVGPSNLVIEQAQLAICSRSTFPWAYRALAVVAPGDRAEIQKCLEISRQHGITVYPLSRGRSWGLGGRMPSNDAIVLDLSRLNRILEIDFEYGTASIEPGVTFEQLQTALLSQGLAYHLPSFGGPVDASVLANALERGEGLGALGDRFSELCDLEVLLSSGEHLRTGHSRCADTTTAKWHKRPAGPLLEGLFSQSGLGIVLSGRVTLAPTLSFASLIVAEVGPDTKIAGAARAVRTLIASGVIDPLSVAIWDSAKRQSSLVTGRSMPADLRDNSSSPGWGISIFVTSAYEEHFAATISCVCNELRPLTEELCVHSDRDESGERARSLMTGFSDGQNVRSCYAGKADANSSAPPKNRDGLNPERDSCGFLWLCPAMPFSGEAIQQVAGHLSKSTKQHGVFGALGLQAVSAHAMHGYVSLAWDRDETGADQRAMACHAQLAQALFDDGFLPYRLALPTLNLVPSAAREWGGVMQRVCAALDPAGIMGRGRIPGLPRS